MLHHFPVVKLNKIIRSVDVGELYGGVGTVDLNGLDAATRGRHLADFGKGDGTWQITHPQAATFPRLSRLAQRDCAEVTIVMLRRPDALRSISTTPAGVDGDPGRGGIV